MKKLKIISLLSLVVLTSIMMVSCGNKSNEPDFENNTVVVIINENFQSREFTLDDFLPVEVIEIRSMSPPQIITPSYRPTLYVTLAELGKQNVLNAINVIGQFDFVYYAGPKYIYTPQPL